MMFVNRRMLLKWGVLLDWSISLNIFFLTTISAPLRQHTTSKKRSLWNIQITHGLLFSLRTKNGKQFVSGLSRSIWRGTELNIGKPHFNSHRPKEKLKGKTAVSKWGTYVLSKPRVQLKSRDRHLQINRSQYTASTTWVSLAELFCGWRIRTKLTNL